MSKYNCIKSIPIDNIPNSEITIAIKEWAEGDESMEKLLLTCYQKNIETNGCHAGSAPYIAFSYKQGIKKIGCILNEVLKIKGSQILISVDGGNPFSGQEWDVATITLSFDTKYKDEADKYLDILNKTLINNKQDNYSHILFDLLEFFLNKESGLLFRIRHNENNEYKFTIESREIPYSRYNYYNELFVKAGLKETIIKELINRHEWELQSKDLDDVLNKIKKASEYIINNFSLEPPKSEDEIISFNIRARYKKKTLSDKDFEIWLEEQGKEIFER